jgi:predicted CDP-diglyceride synthetase/phosphatidate cytidylyltransferase
MFGILIPVCGFLLIPGLAALAGDPRDFLARVARTQWGLMSKTVEGLVGGGASAIAPGAALWRITPFAPWQAALMSAAIVAMGVLGGLALSATKRSLGVKDWGTMGSGHGGVLERRVSVAFAAPVCFHLKHFVFTRGGT